MQPVRTSFVIGSACALIACSGSSDSSTRPGAWSARAALPTPRQEMPSALLGGRIYTPGGIDADRSAEVRMDVYDPATDRWTPAPPLPEARHHFGIAVAGGKLYVIGGYQPGPLPWAPSDAVFEFDPATQAWTRKAPMPAPRAAHVSVELGGVSTPSAA